MSWSEGFPRRVALAGLLALAGCGFAPVYGPGGPAAALRGRVAVEVPATDAGFVLRQRLLDRLGRGEHPAFQLSVEIATSRNAVATTNEEATQRYNLEGTARYVLTEATTGAERLSGEVGTFTGYSATGTAVSTSAARRDAQDRLSVALADRIVTRLLVAAPDLTP